MERLIHGDCLEVMRTLESESVDAVVTDPPYCSGGFTETAKRQAKGQGIESQRLRDIGWFVNDNMTTAGLVWLLRSVAVEAYRLLRDGGSALVFTDWRMLTHLAPALESSGMRLQNIVVWDKGAPGLGNGFRPRHEMIIHLVKGTGKFHAVDGANVISVGRVRGADKQHQTEKPVELMERLLRVVAPAGGTVLDPFMGSGTTLVAAKRLGMNAVGVERSTEYVEIARKRRAATSAPLFAAQG